MGGKRGKKGSNYAGSSVMPVHKVVMVGEGGVGKSAVTLRFMYNDFVEEYDPTKADSYRRKMEVPGSDGERGETCQVAILDTAGQEEYVAIRDNYYRSGEGFIILFSITDRASFQAVQDFYDHIHRVVGYSYQGDARVPVVLVGNKADLESRRKVSREEAQDMAREWGCQYIETSAKTKLNVEKLYDTVVRLIMAEKQRRVENAPKKRAIRCHII